MIECPKDIEAALTLFQSVCVGPSPFDNSGEEYKGKSFYACSYRWLWDEDIDGPEPPNFKWRDLEVTWYKYLGRGMYANRELTETELVEMVNECLTEILNDTN